jgi:hypothetical protein
VRGASGGLGGGSQFGHILIVTDDRAVGSGGCLGVGLDCRRLVDLGVFDDDRVLDRLAFERVVFGRAGDGVAFVVVTGCPVVIDEADRHRGRVALERRRFLDDHCIDEHCAIDAHRVVGSSRAALVPIGGIAVVEAVPCSVCVVVHERRLRRGVERAGDQRVERQLDAVVDDVALVVVIVVAGQLDGQVRRRGAEQRNADGVGVADIAQHSGVVVLRRAGIVRVRGQGAGSKTVALVRGRGRMPRTRLVR